MQSIDFTRLDALKLFQTSFSIFGLFWNLLPKLPPENYHFEKLGAVWAPSSQTIVITAF